MLAAFSPDSFNPMKPARLNSSEEVLRLFDTGEYIAQPKTDGIRACWFPAEQLLVSADRKIFPAHVQQLAKENFAHVSEPLDIELTGWYPNKGIATFQSVVSFYMSHESGNPEKFEPVFMVFDYLGYGTYAERVRQLDAWFSSRKIGLDCSMVQCFSDRQQVIALLESAAARAIEGIILRKLSAEGYRAGRCTLGDDYAFKFVPVERREAKIIGYFRRKENGIAMRRLGGFVVQDIKTGLQFKIGNGQGWTMEWRDAAFIRAMAGEYDGANCMYECKAFGEKTLPRSPQFVAFSNDAMESLETSRWS